MSEGEHTCKCGETFETLDRLKEHARENHPDLYEEKFSS